MTKMYPETEVNHYNVKDSYFLAFSKVDPESAAVLEQASTSREVKPNKNSVKAALEKNNNPYTYPDPDDIVYKLAEDFTTRYLLDKCNFLQMCKIPGQDEVTFNGASSAGLIGKKTGHPKTKGYIESDTFKKFSLNCDFLPLQLVVTKDEFLDIETDLSRNKCRLVDITGKEDIYKSKILYDNQNKALHDNCETSFIKYGMTKQYGGFDRLVTSFEGCSFISKSDCSGYDKSAVLTGVYAIRNKCLVLPQDGSEERELYEKLMDYVTHHTLNPIRVLHDGTVILQDHSNSSGQNNTTTDNSILHLIICFYLAIVIYAKTHKQAPLYRELIEYIQLAIYSDDKIFGIRGECSLTIEELVDVEREVYRRFGMTIKESASEWITHQPGELFKDGEIEFLGGTCHWEDGFDMYLPIPRVGKLCTSVTRTLVETKVELDPVEQFTKLVSILSLLVEPSDAIYKALARFVYHTYLEYPKERYVFDDIIKAHHLKDISTLSAYKPNAIWTNQSGREFFKGNEVFRGLRFLNFFSIGEDRDGFKNYSFEKMDTTNTNNVDIPKVEKKIEDITKRVGITEEGETWLKECLDPFHDTPYRSVGFPDLITGNSVVQYVKQSWDYVVPATYAQDVHIFMDSVDTRELIYSNNRYNEGGVYRNHSWSANASGGVGSYPRGGLVLRNSGTTGSGTTLSTVTGTNFVGGLPRTYLSDSRCRVISKGFEVVNTTPMINAGGAVTVYRDSTSTAYYPGGTGNLYNSVTPTYNASHTLYPLAKVPETIAQVNLIPGVQTWEAAKGCYCVCTMSSQVNNAGEEPSALLVTNDSSSAANTDYISAYGTGNVPVLSDAYGVVSLISPFFVSGAYFTGLPPGTSLRISSVYIIERFVDQTNLDLVVLSSPSPYYDPVALQLYARAAHRLPHGVPVDRNDTGEWIKSIADVLGTFGVPGMPLVKGAVDAFNTGRKIIKVINPSGKEVSDEKKDKRYREMEIALQKYRNAQPVPKNLPAPKKATVKGNNSLNTGKQAQKARRQPKR